MPSYVILGASRGIGFALAKKLAEDDKNTVVGIVRNVDDAKAKYEAELPGRKNVHVVHGDLNNRKSLEAAAGSVAAITGGAVDVFVANGATISHVNKPLVAEFTDGPDEFEKGLLDVYRTNVVGTACAMACFVPLVEKGTLKKIAAISSISGLLDFTLKTSFAEHTAYAVSKAALNMVVVKLHLELRDKGITVLAVSPGVVDTDILKQSTTLSTTEADQAAQQSGPEALIEQFKRYDPDWEPQMLTPDESAEAVLKVIAGASIEKDGGTMVSHYGNQKWL